MGKVIDMDNMDLDQVIDSATLPVRGVINTQNLSFERDMTKVIEDVRKRARNSEKPFYNEEFLMNVNGTIVEVSADADSKDINPSCDPRPVTLTINGKTIYNEVNMLNSRNVISDTQIKEGIKDLRTPLEDVVKDVQEQGIEM